MSNYQQLQKENDYHKNMWEGQINRTKLAEQQRDQLAARCAELEKLNQSAELQVTRLISIVAELERKAKALDEVFAKCQVVFFPLDGHYIEHNLAAHKDNREAIEFATRKEK